MYASFDEVRSLAAKLRPNGAFLVVPDYVEPDEDAARLQVIRLRDMLHGKVAEYKVALIKDHVRRGVWVFRPKYRHPHNRDAVGPAKEDEVRRRPVVEV